MWGDLSEGMLPKGVVSGVLALRGRSYYLVIYVKTGDLLIKSSQCVVSARWWTTKPVPYSLFIESRHRERNKEEMLRSVLWALAVGNTVVSVKVVVKNKQDV